MSQDLYGQWLDTQKNWLENVSKLGNESMTNQWTAPYKTWLDSQEKAYESYQKAIGGDQQAPSLFNPFMPQANQLFNPFQALQNFDQVQKDSVKAWQDAYKNSPMGQYMAQLPNMNDYTKQMQNLFQVDPSTYTKFLSKDTRDIFAKMTNASQIYENMYKFYQEFVDTVAQPAGKELEKTWNQLVEQGKVNYQTLVEPFIPVQVKAFMEAPQQMLEALSQQNDTFWKPWKDAAEDLTYLYNQSLLGDTAKLSEFYDLWQDTYAQTFGAVIKSPLMGNNAEFYEAQNQYMDQLVRLLVVSSEFSSKLSQVTQTHLKNHMKDFMELVEKNEQPKTYKEFYYYWSKQIESTLNAYFYTDEFAELLGEFSSAFAQARTRQNAVLERYLANTPIVLESDMRSLYKKVHEMKREIRSLKKELKELHASDEVEANAPVKAAAKPARKPAARATKSSTTTAKESK